jgi:hypothetical protein
MTTSKHSAEAELSTILNRMVENAVVRSGYRDAVSRLLDTPGLSRAAIHLHYHQAFCAIVATTVSLEAASG